MEACRLIWRGTIRHHEKTSHPYSKGYSDRFGHLKGRWVTLALADPIGSMYAIYGNIYHQYTPNVSIYPIHGSYGYRSRSLIGSNLILGRFDLGHGILSTTLVSASGAQGGAIASLFTTMLVGGFTPLICWILFETMIPTDQLIHTNIYILLLSWWGWTTNQVLWYCWVCLLDRIGSLYRQSAQLI